MSSPFRSFAQQAISGQARGPRAALLRTALAVIEPCYATAMRARNLKYDRGIGVRRLPRPVISVGNLTTGGTGKTPVVRWLCDRLRDAGRRPAVLMRGYGAKPGERGDEQAMLESLLNPHGAQVPVIIHAQPRRHAGGLAVLAAHPNVDCFVMDDGFQHRRLARDFDLVLIDASNPFGFDHVIPRGLLREPLSGLRRAHAILITRADQGDADAITHTVRLYNSAAPVYRCVHAHVALRAADDSTLPIEDLAARPAFAFAAIGNPAGLARQLESAAKRPVPARWFPDHWNYSDRDISDIRAEAAHTDAQCLLTTEKDWAKVKRLTAATIGGLPILRVDLAIKFEATGETALFDQIIAHLSPTEMTS